MTLLRWGWTHVAVLSLVVTLGTSVSTLRAEGECTLRVGWEPYGVYTFKNDEGVVTGVDIEVVRAVARELGCDLTFRELPWARILLEVEQGAVDVSTSTSHTPERARYGRFSRPYRPAEMALFVRKSESGRYPLTSLADVAASEFRLGVIDGYFLGEEFAHAMTDPLFAAHVEGAADYAVNLRKLLHGRIDGFLVDDVGVLIDEARDLGILDAVERHPLAIAGDDLHFMFSKKSVDPDTAAAFDRALERLEADGSIDEIFDRFIARNVATGGPP